MIPRILAIKSNFHQAPECCLSADGKVACSHLQSQAKQHHRILFYSHWHNNLWVTLQNSPRHGKNKQFHISNSSKSLHYQVLAGSVCRCTPATASTISNHTPRFTTAYFVVCIVWRINVYRGLSTTKPACTALENSNRASYKQYVSVPCPDKPLIFYGIQLHEMVCRSMPAVHSIVLTGCVGCSSMH